MKRSEKLRKVQEEIGYCFEDLKFFKTSVKLEKKRLKKLQKIEIKLQQMD